MFFLWQLRLLSNYLGIPYFGTKTPVRYSRWLSPLSLLKKRWDPFFASSLTITRSRCEKKHIYSISEPLERHLFVMNCLNELPWETRLYKVFCWLRGDERWISVNRKRKTFMSFFEKPPVFQNIDSQNVFRLCWRYWLPFSEKKIAGNYLEKLLKPKTPFVFNRLGFVEKTEKMHSVSISSFESILC